MKTEKQVEGYLEKVVNGVEALVKGIDAQPARKGKAAKANAEQKIQLGFMLGAMFALGTVLDAEEELKQIMAKMSMAAVLEKASGIF